MSTPVGVVLGGASAEHDVSVITGLQAVHALVSAGRDVVPLYWSKTGEWWRLPVDVETRDLAEGPPASASRVELQLGAEGGFVEKGRLRSQRLAVDVVVNACHGGPGEDGSLQALLDQSGIAYTGPDRASAAMAMDKLAFAAVSAVAGLPQLPRAAYVGDVDAAPDFDGPWIVKPRFGGSSIGTEVVVDLDALRALVRHGVHMRGGAVVEPFLDGAVDLNVGLRRHPQVQVSAVERPLRGDGAAMLGFADKYVSREGMAGAARELPAALPDDLTATIRSHGAVVARTLPVRGVARLDFLLHGDELYVNELNSIPGSFGRYLWIDPRVDFVQLLDDMLDEARAVPAYRPVTDGADGALLRDAGSIAAKLR